VKKYFKRCRANRVCYSLLKAGGDGDKDSLDEEVGVIAGIKPFRVEVNRAYWTYLPCITSNNFFEQLIELVKLHLLFLILNLL